MITRSKPKWNPPTFELVDVETIKQYFIDSPNDFEFKPLLAGGNYMDIAHREFMLPSSTEILRVAKKFGPKNAAEYFLELYKDKKGVKAKLTDTLDVSS